MISQVDILEFVRLFSGAKEFYGTTIVGDIVDGKAKSTSTCIHETPLPTIYENHLNGKASIGISPLKADDTVEFGAIDIDDYKGDLMNIVRAIYDYELPICPCYSKSRKLHLYFFFAIGTKASEAVTVMRWYAKAFGCDKKVEVFPKQTERTINNKAYSWINLPYFDEGDERNHRKMVARDGTTVDITEFLDRAKRCKQDIQWHDKQIKLIPCFDAPPCVLTSLLLNDVLPGMRNNWLFSVGVYLRLKDEQCDLELELEGINNRLPDPLPSDELRNTVLKSLEKKSYFYMCSSMEHCNKLECQRLEFGVGSAKSTGLTYGDLVQYMTDPPTYDWTINGQKMHFYSEKELMGQEQFRALCLRNLHLVPRKVDDNRWSKLLTKSAENMKVVYYDNKGGDFSKGSQFYDLVCKFFGAQRRAVNMSQVGLGRVFLDESKSEFVFMASALMAFVEDTHSFKGLSQNEMRTRLEDWGAYRVGNLWRIPQTAFPEDDLQQKVAEIDFTDTTADSEDF